ncbi:hypothetical protein, partial [Mangrovihabitans endophyticus]|uniref:hypothetical protein n=1 Tax=Mangrovihabitans endophyticus TaxID=1751298 RepID=UPI001E5F0F17
TDWVRSVAVGQLDGRTIIVSGSNDNTVRVWNQADPPTSRIEIRIAIDAASTIYDLAINHPDVVVVATELGVIVVRLGRQPCSRALSSANPETLPG